MVTSFLKESDVIFNSEKNVGANREYSILLKDTLVTPYGLDVWFNAIDDAIESLNIFITSIKFPHLYEFTKNTGGKIVFIEQLSLCLSNLEIIKFY